MAMYMTHMVKPNTVNLTAKKATRIRVVVSGDSGMAVDSDSDSMIGEISGQSLAFICPFRSPGVQIGSTVCLLDQDWQAAV